MIFLVCVKFMKFVQITHWNHQGKSNYRDKLPTNKIWKYQIMQLAMQVIRNFFQSNVTATKVKVILEAN
jgi:hypothetical protein